MTNRNFEAKMAGTRKSIKNGVFLPLNPKETNPANEGQ